MSQTLSNISMHISKWMYKFAIVILTGMMVFGVLDVVLRYFGRPITGMYELIALGGATVLGLSLPRTSLDRAHICVEMLVEVVPVALKKAFFCFTKIIGILFFIALAFGLIYKGHELQSANEATLTVRLPLYPFAYVLGFCSLVESFVLFSLLFLDYKDIRKGGEI